MPGPHGYRIAETFSEVETGKGADALLDRLTDDFWQDVEQMP